MFPLFEHTFYLKERENVNWSKHMKIQVFDIYWHYRDIINAANNYENMILTGITYVHLLLKFTYRVKM